MHEFLRTLLDKLIFFKVSDRINEQSKHHFHVLLCKKLEIIFPLQALVKDFNTLYENCFNLEVINELIGLVEEGGKDNLKQTEWILFRLVHDGNNAHHHSL